MELKSSGWFYTIFTITLITEIQICICSKMVGPLKGNNQLCRVEGEPYEVAHIDKSRCFRCTCVNGFVECERPCRPTNGCYMLEKHTGCCEICKGCIYRGRYYESYSEWIDPLEPCITFRCEATVITETKVQCYTPCSNPIPPKSGQCCPSCPDRTVYGDPISSSKYISRDPCVNCSYSDGKMTCFKRACPILNCPNEKIYNQPGKCCPVCIGSRQIYTANKTCLMFPVGVLKEGAVFQFDKCTTCYCKNDTSICHRKSCPVLECAPKYQKWTDDNNCCKECIEAKDSYEIQEFSSHCSYDDKYYKDGETWQLNQCTTCTCINGGPSCTRTICNISNHCPLGSHYVHQPDQCCGKCIESDGVCMAFGDPHYKTFDGYIYSFKAPGRYQLVSDCVSNTFSIRVVNEFNTKNKTSTITKRALIKFSDTRINLGQRFKTKVNGIKVTFPYFHNKFEINKTADSIKITLFHDIKILWNGRSFLEVTVPPKYKKKLCGLCGNFNSVVKDDLRKRKGTLVQESNIGEFARSWCVGKSCAKNYPNHSCTKRKGRKRCEILSNYKLFNECNATLNYKKYFRACMIDMCDCPDGKCYCDSLMAYIQECKRLGIDIEDWRKYSYCSSNVIRRPRPHKEREIKILYSQFQNRSRLPNRANGSSFSIPIS